MSGGHTPIIHKIFRHHVVRGIVSVFAAGVVGSVLGAFLLAGLLPLSLLTQPNVLMATEMPVMVMENLAEADTFTEPVDEQELSGTLPEAATATRSTSSVELIASPLAYLSRVAGDPPVKPNEIAVRVPILMYHQIRPWPAVLKPKEKLFTVTPEAFAAQMEGLVRAGYTTITPEDLEYALRAGPSVLPKKSVLLTFDDGYANQYTNAFPILKRLNLHATFFIVSRANALKGFMTDAMVQDMDHSGLITIASHTQHHVFLARIGYVSRETELRESKADLEKLLGHPITFFAYPYGSWSSEVADEVKQDGYTLGFGVRLGSLHTPSSAFQLRRIRVLDREDVVALCDEFLKPHRVSASIVRP